MIKKEDISSSLKPHNIKIDNMSLNSMITMIKENMNPFEEPDSSYLFNIATGKAASKSTEEFLLNVANIGEKERKKFILECIEDPMRFTKAIKRQKHLKMDGMISIMS